MPQIEIKGREYDIPQRFRVCDPVLIRDVTGLSFQEFAETLDNPLNDGEIDPIALAGLIAVAIWQKFPTWPRGQVVRYTQELEEDDWKITGVEQGPAEADHPDPLPAPEATTTEASDDSSASSSSDSAAPSKTESQKTSGGQPSPDGSQDSLPTDSPS